MTGALCKAAYDNDNPNALAEVFPAMNEAEIQGVQDFLKRFGCKLASYSNFYDLMDKS